jgi:DNA-binding IclR family transcriptional regulator
MPRTRPTPVRTKLPEKEGAEPVGNKATGRVLVVLSRLAEGAGSYGVTELSRELGMTKNMVYRALSTLLRHGYVVRDRSGSRYQLGPGVLALAGGGLPDLNLPEFTTPYMRRLREIAGETVTLAVPWGRNAVTVAGVRGRGVVARRIPLGRIMPLHISPASRAMLAAFPDAAIDEYLEQPL